VDISDQSGRRFDHLTAHMSLARFGGSLAPLWYLSRNGDVQWGPGPGGPSGIQALPLLRLLQFLWWECNARYKNRTHVGPHSLHGDESEPRFTSVAPKERYHLVR
jgi:hypothetical protein